MGVIAMRKSWIKWNMWDKDGKKWDVFGKKIYI